jgi:helix-turn-helix, Psq domain.
MSVISKDERMEMALKAYHKGRFKSKTACAKAYDMPKSTLTDRLNRMTSRKELLANGQKLSVLKEETLKKWIIDMYERGLGLGISRVRYLTQLLLSARLKPQPKLAPISEMWVYRFIQHYSLQTKWNSRYNYQRAKYKDSQIIKG